MSSNERSHSAVRNLRSIFENKATADTTAESPVARGRSPIGPKNTRDTASGRPLSRVRASFVAVEPPKMAMPSAGSDMSVADMGRASSIQARRGSFSIDNQDQLSILDLKQGVADERVRRESRPDLGTPMPENALDSAAATPVMEPREDQAMGTINHAASKLSEMTIAPGNENEPPADPESEPPANPDKPNTGAEEEEGEMKPAEAVNEAAVSGGEALPPPTEDLTKQNVESEAHGLGVGKTNGTSEHADTSSKPEVSAAQEATPAKEPTPKVEPTPKTSTPAQKRGSMAPQTSISKPSSISANRTKKDSADLKSPTSPPSTAKPTATSKEPARKPSRTSLAAPTAASKARTSSSEKRASSTHTSKPRESTKPADVPSRLLAPTAASRARHEAEQAAPAKPTTSTNRQNSSTRPSKPQVSSSKPAPRASTAARPESRSSHTSATRRPAPSGEGGSFLDRMMRPTAASAQKVHEKPEVKSPPRKTSAPAAKKPATAMPKTNGSAKPAAKAGATEKPLSKAALENAAEKTEEGKQVDSASEVPAEAPEDPAKEVEDVAEQKGGIETPVGEPAKDEEKAAQLEGTPAFGEEGIR